MTNYESIINMSIDEMTECLFGGKAFCPYLTYWNMSKCAKKSCAECIKQWLESEATGNE